MPRPRAAGRTAIPLMHKSSPRSIADAVPATEWSSKAIHTGPSFMRFSTESLAGVVAAKPSEVYKFSYSENDSRSAAAISVASAGTAIRIFTSASSRLITSHRSGNDVSALNYLSMREPPLIAKSDWLTSTGDDAMLCQRFCLGRVGPRVIRDGNGFGPWPPG